MHMTSQKIVLRNDRNSKIIFRLLNRRRFGYPGTHTCFTMGTFVYSTDIRPEHYQLRLGAIVGANLVEMRTRGVNVCLIRVSNGNLYGNFRVPLALGFSTPMHMLEGATLYWCRCQEKPADALENEYLAWVAEYDHAGCRAPGTQDPSELPRLRHLAEQLNRDNQNMIIALAQAKEEFDRARQKP
jgi:hypothetical protein